jgi:hypothetical protein
MEAVTEVSVPPVPRGVVALFDGGYWWRVRSGGFVPIAEMTPEHRYSTARMLERHAGAYQMRYETELLSSPLWTAAPDDVDVWFSGPPEAWVRGTRLYRALVAGLPTREKPLRKLAERARHWSACPMRLRPKDRPEGAVCSCAEAARAAAGEGNV